MIKIQLIISVFLLIFNNCLAQEKKSKNLFYGDLTYGFETNIGNTGVFIGAGYQRSLSGKFIFQTDLHYFTTAVFDNNWQEKKDFRKQKWFEHSGFLSVKLGYAVIGKTDKFNVTIKGGLSLFNIKQRNLSGYVFTFYPNGTPVPEFDHSYRLRKNWVNVGDTTIYGVGVVIPSSIKYKENNKLGFGYNFGIDVNFPIKKNQFLTIGFLSLSQENPLQYLFFPIPVISYKVKI
jgi:hypothetical protein